MKESNFPLLSDCNGPAGWSEEPDTHSYEPVQRPQATVLSDHSRWLWGRQGHPGLARQQPQQAAHLYCRRQLDAWQDTGAYCLIHLSAFVDYTYVVLGLL